MRCDAMRCDAMRCDAMRCDAMRCDAMRCDAMRCDAMRCDAMRCGAIVVVNRREVEEWSAKSASTPVLLLEDEIVEVCLCAALRRHSHLLVTRWCAFDADPGDSQSHESSPADVVSTPQRDESWLHSCVAVCGVTSGLQRALALVRCAPMSAIRP
jgi:hypothetical protein